MVFAVVLYRLGWLLVFLAVGMVSPVVFALIGQDSVAATAFIASGLASAFCGVGLLLSLRGYRSAEGLPVALTFLTLAWVVVPFFAALPLYATGLFPVFGDAYFEAVSALTTTGATLIEPGQIIAPAVAVWRAVLQWLGGLGTLVMASVIFAALFWKGVPIANVPLPWTRDTSLLGRFSSAVNLILPLYLLMTIVLFLLIWASGVPVFDAFCLAMTTVSTGGMVPGPVGLAGYDAPLLPWILGIGMAACGFNIMLLWYALRGRFAVYVKDVEASHYMLFLAVAMLITMACVALVLGLDSEDPVPVTGSLKDYADAAFLAVSLVSTTGFEPPQSATVAILPSPLILAFIAIGGSALSTAGGLKVIRLVLMLKHANRELSRLAHPHGVTRVIYGGVQVDERVLAKIGAVGIAVIIVFTGVTLGLAACGLSFEAATAASVAALSNCGPALMIAIKDPDGFRTIPELGRVIACIAMIFGRLEVLALISVINPMYWRRM